MRGRVRVGAAFVTGVRRLYRNARLLDPESGLDAPGDLLLEGGRIAAVGGKLSEAVGGSVEIVDLAGLCLAPGLDRRSRRDRKSTRLNSSHVAISYAVFCLKKKQILC